MKIKETKQTPCRDENKAMEKKKKKKDRIVDACEQEFNKQKNGEADKSKIEIARKTQS